MEGREVYTHKVPFQQLKKKSSYFPNKHFWKYTDYGRNSSPAGHDTESDLHRGGKWLAMERYICWGEGGQGLESRALGGVTTGTVTQAAGPVTHLSPVTTSRQWLPIIHLMGVPGKDDIQGEQFLPSHTRKDSERQQWDHKRSLLKLRFDDKQGQQLTGLSERKLNLAFTNKPRRNVFHWVGSQTGFHIGSYLEWFW